MHEMGTVVYIIDTVNKLCEENNIDKVLYVKVQVGEVSGIIPSYLTDFQEMRMMIQVRNHYMRQ